MIYNCGSKSLLRRWRNGRSSGEGGEHRRSHPCDHLAGVVRANAGKSPGRGPRENEAFSAAEHGAPGEQNADRNPGLAEEVKRKEIKQARECRARETSHHCPLCAVGIGGLTGPNARYQCGGELTARDNADHRGAETQPVLNIKRKDRKDRADNKKGDQHGSNYPFSEAEMGRLAG